MIGSLLLRGMLIGVLAGLVAYCFAYTFGEPQIDRAIAVEVLIGHADANEQGHPDAHGSTDEHGAHATSSHAHDEEEVFSRETQAGLGMLTGMLVFSATTGGILGFGEQWNQKPT
ncbi:CbtA family protein [Stutzerimonas stutzeri]|uniref:CbtA family protein n=1 Tax=Stutzerimonas stutzeri TaxID=316 RepID=UPI0021124CA0|nr:CbtA family protein [Stutzerimonas stutzeri]UUC82790.1 CbtA family protein [Stutzerimonas stutzeri]